MSDISNVCSVSEFKLRTSDSGSEKKKEPITFIIILPPFTLPVNAVDAHSHNLTHTYFLSAPPLSSSNLCATAPTSSTPSSVLSSPTHKLLCAMDESLLSQDDEPQVIVRSQKGKVATKGSWTDLPPEVLRYVLDAFPRRDARPFRSSSPLLRCCCSQVANILFVGTFNFWVGHPTPSWRDWSAGKQPQLWATLMALQEISSIRLVCMNWQAASESQVSSLVL